MLSYFKLFRWPNLIIIILTQGLMKTSVFDALFKEIGYAYPISSNWFAVLILATVFVAIAGYIGNDIADVQIDKINRPKRPLASGAISISQARIVQLLFELLGFSLGLILSVHVGHICLSSIFLLIIILMRMYSISLKCKGLIGNIIIAFSSAMVPAVVWIFGVVAMQTTPLDISMYLNIINIITIFYVGFAFIFTLIREIVKDLEDLRGDKQSACNTMAVRLPLQKLKNWLIILNVIALIGILLFQYILFSNEDLVLQTLFIANFASIELIILFFIIPKIITANSSLDFYKIGNTLKIIMFSGILQMLFLLF